MLFFTVLSNYYLSMNKQIKGKINKTMPLSNTNKLKTKQKLLKVGLQLFSSYGFEGVSISDLERAVGLKAGTGSFYRHFDNKLELLHAIAEKEIEEASIRRTKELGALESKNTDFKESLQEHFELALEGLYQSDTSLRLFMREKEHFPDLFLQFRSEVLDKAQATVIEHYAKKINSRDLIQVDPIMLTTIVQSALFGFSQAKLFMGEVIDDEFERNFIETLLEIVVNKLLTS